jgi:hypothetical protein
VTAFCRSNLAPILVLAANDRQGAPPSVLRIPF